MKEAGGRRRPPWTSLLPLLSLLPLVLLLSRPRAAWGYYYGVTGVNGDPYNFNVYPGSINTIDLDITYDYWYVELYLSKLGSLQYDVAFLTNISCYDPNMGTTTGSFQSNFNPDKALWDSNRRAESSYVIVAHAVPHDSSVSESWYGYHITIVDTSPNFLTVNATTPVFYEDETAIFAFQYYLNIHPPLKSYISVSIRVEGYPICEMTRLWMNNMREDSYLGMSLTYGEVPYLYNTGYYNFYFTVDISSSSGTPAPSLPDPNNK